MLVKLCAIEPGVYGARLTGGGFGGSIVALVEPGRAAGIGERIAAAYHQATGEAPTILVPERRSDESRNLGETHASP